MNIMRGMLWVVGASKIKLVDYLLVVIDASGSDNQTNV